MRVVLIAYKDAETREWTPLAMVPEPQCGHDVTRNRMIFELLHTACAIERGIGHDHPEVCVFSCWGVDTDDWQDIRCLLAGAAGPKENAGAIALIERVAPECIEAAHRDLFHSFYPDLGEGRQ